MSGPTSDRPAGVDLFLAPNPGPMTLDGTNTWRITAPGAPQAPAVVVDPGPDDDGHLRRVAAAGPVALVVVTHRHRDHTAGAARFAQLTGAPVRGADPAECVAAAPLEDGEILEVGGAARLRVVTTPGHTTDSICLELLDGDGVTVAVLTGDTILGRGTTVIAHPDGRLGPYLDSLRRLGRLGPVPVLPGHGPVRPDLAAVCAEYLTHRGQRLEQVRAVLDRIGPNATVAEVTDVVYDFLDPADHTLRGAAERSVAAQLDHLRDARP